MNFRIYDRMERKHFVIRLIREEKPMDSPEGEIVTKRVARVRRVKTLS